MDCSHTAPAILYFLLVMGKNTSDFNDSPKTASLVYGISIWSFALALHAGLSNGRGYLGSSLQAESETTENLVGRSFSSQRRLGQKGNNCRRGCILFDKLYIIVL